MYEHEICSNMLFLTFKREYIVSHFPQRIIFPKVTANFLFQGLESVILDRICEQFILKRLISKVFNIPKSVSIFN